jgi:hypothetical protein
VKLMHSLLPSPESTLFLEVRTRKFNFGIMMKVFATTRVSVILVIF